MRTGGFHLLYVTRRGRHGATVITVPKALHYPNGYRVSVAGARVVAKNADSVRLRNRPRARHVAVAITPPPGDTTPRPALLPCG